MKTLIVGDIHGCYSEFQDLLARSGIADGDSIIALGDIVDRGPETPQVLDFFRQHPNARSLMGNHERKHVRAARGELELSLSQVIARAQLGESYPDSVRFMATFPTWIELPEAILVHGYVEPGIPLEEQKATVLCGTMGGDKYLSSRYDRDWYELYDRQKPVIVGHLDYGTKGEVFIYQERVFGLDTSCVLGKTLSGLILPDFTIVSVPSRGNHWSAVRRKYRQQHAAASRQPKPAAPDWDEGSEKLLHEILEWVKQENEKVMARLQQQAGFESLTPRQQSKAYAAEIGDTPLAALLHLARRGELDDARARQVVRNPLQVAQIARLANAL